MSRLQGVCRICVAVFAFAGATLAQAPDGAVLLDVPKSEIALHAADAPPASGPARVHVLVDADARTVRRQMVRIADMFPGQTLDFQWSPEPTNETPTAAGSDFAQGAGVLIWRIKGVPSYDTRNVFARYHGTLRDGYPDGHGEIKYRSGKAYVGDWVAGRPHGSGTERTADGEHYVGGFANGLREGSGRLVLGDRTILNGPFKGGLAHGDFTVTLPGGTVYSSVWDNGHETDRALDAVYQDSTLAGLLKAQSGDAASRSSLAVVLDAQTTAQSEIRYVAAPGADRTLIYTENPDLVNAWNGTSPMKSGPDAWMLFDQPWQEVYAYLNVILQMNGGPAQLDRLWLEVTSSVAYRKPMLQTSFYYGAAKFNANYGLFNNGWGAVEAAEFTFKITDPTGRTSGSQNFTVPVSPFDREGSFNLESVLTQHGIDVPALKNARFPCASRAVLNQCFTQTLSSLNLGSLGPFIGSLDNALVFAIDGTLSFSWTDASGQRQSATQPIQNYIHVATMDLGDLAELGSGWADVPEALSHVDIVLPVGRENYFFDLPFRAGSSVSQFVYPIKIRSDMASTHDFRIGAQFRDGSIRYSAPSSLFYFRPRN
ncbi:MAG: hypothetical protein ABJD13_21180 [Paracoccaceae bacterium]